ncbi:hypothetical protein PIB30_100680 [Stylosanthes scabra]|uniref:Aminotransferase-like plant mobile domain-containing protein n=1 Tax=Stylosanthes scabra TaxID=79078 RepID=A0ABU6RXS8_9FABA|nr:hypothetical protein [Stylosanthes scabra]
MVTFSWLKSRFGNLPRDASDKLVLRSLCRAANRNVVQVAGRWICWRAGFYGGFRSFGLTISTTSSGHWPPGGIGISPHPTRRLQAHRRQLDLMPFSEFVCLPYRTPEVEVVLDQSILQEDHRALWCSIVPLIYYGTIEWHQVDRFGGVQNRPHPALNIDFLREKDGRGSDQWFPQTYQRWHGLWATRFEQLFEVVQSADPGPTADFIQWWILAAKRYLVPADHFHRFQPDEIPRPGRMMVGTRTTARDWQWSEDMMIEDTQGGASTSQAVEEAGTSLQAYLPSTPQTQGTTIPSSMSSPSQQAFLDGLSSPGFQHFISDMFQEGDSGYRSDTQSDGSQFI